LSLDFMAFFKFFQRDNEATAPSGPLESVEVLRKRAKHRLIGTVVLVLAGVIGFPLLVDKQPRPIAVDIPIEIPDKNKVKPLALPSVTPQAVPEAKVSEAKVPVAAPVVAPLVAAKPEPKVEAKPVEKIAEKEPVKVTPKESPKEVAKPVVKELAKTPEKAPEKAAEKPLAKPAEKPSPDSAARAQALLDGKEPPPASAPAAEDRLVVQVGAFADAGKAREARLKLERAGLKTYTQEVQTKDGLRIRVRVGPFGSRADADKAADKIKKLDLSAAILTL
jgi:DedD protein